MSAHQQMIQEQLDEGLRALQHTANQLMHEVASEVWRTAGGDKEEVQSKLLEALSRDQSIKSLIAHTDERFQALAVRTARLEDTLNMLAEGMRAARDELALGVEALTDAQASPAARGVADIRARLDDVINKVGYALETLAERDRAIVESVQVRVREHAELVSTETAAITRAMESYVQQGVAVIGQLATDVEAQLASIRERDEEITARINGSAQEQLNLLDQRIGEIAELTSSFGEYLELMHDRVGMESRDVLQVVEASARETGVALEARVKGLAELVRSDTTALRNELVRTAAAQDETIARALDERLGRVNETLTTATDWMVDEISRRMREEAFQSIRLRLDEAIATIDRRADETTRLVGGRLDDAVITIDRNMVRMSDTLEGQLDRLARTVGDRAAEAVTHALESTEGTVANALASTHEAVTRAQISTEETVSQTIDARVAALAKMVRSDNESLARQIVSDQEASKQALRSMKELQASLPADVIETIQRRMDDLAESVAKSQEMLAQRIDRMAAKIGERYDNDIQVVIDRMGDAMHALAGLGRTPQAAESDRIELE